VPCTHPTRRGRALATELEERDRAFWRMRPAERVAAMRRGDLSLSECLRWASRAAHEVPVLDGEFEFIAARTPEAAEGAP